MKRSALVVVLCLFVAALLTGCGERDDRRFPDLPKSHTLNQKTIW